MALKWYVVTTGGNGRVIETHTLYFGGDEDLARRAFASRDGCQRFWKRELKNYETGSGKETSIETAVIGSNKSDPVTMSPKFRRVLERIGEESRVAAVLLSPENTHIAEVDFVDIYENDLTFLPDGRMPSPDDNFQGSSRQSGRPARVARKMLKPDILATLNDKDFELFATLVNADIQKFDTPRIVEGEDLRYWYHEDQQAEPKFASCMRYAKAQKFLDIYAFNPDKIKLCILTDPNDKLLGRALVWHLDDGKIFMDRVYGNEVTVRKINKFADAQGWWRRNYNVSSTLEIIAPGGERAAAHTLFCTVKHATFDYYPHMDTLGYVDTDTGRITNNRGRKWTRYGHGTEGLWTKPADGTIWPPEDGGPRVQKRCRGCMSRVPEDQEVLGYTDPSSTNFYCQRCAETAFPLCGHCQERTDRYYLYETDDPNVKMCVRCWAQRFYRCSYCGQIHRLSQKHYTNSDGMHYCPTCTVTKIYVCYAKDCPDGYQSLHAVDNFNFGRSVCNVCHDAGRHANYDDDEDYVEDPWGEDEP